MSPTPGASPMPTSSVPGAQQPYDGLGGVDLSIPVRAVNNSAEPVMWMYDRRKYVLKPGVPIYIPYLAMCMYRGDPRAIDKPGGRDHEQYRRNEHARLHILHGVYEGGPDHRSWDEVANVTCYPIDSDVPFHTVLDDPEGLSLSDERRDSSQTEFLQGQMEQMSAQLRILQAQVLNQQQADGAVEAAGLTPADIADLDRQATSTRTIAPEGLAESMVGASPARKRPSAKTRVKPGEGPAVTTDA